MTPQEVLGIGFDALVVTMLVAAPALLAALGAGLIVSVFQAATQINEVTLSFIPKLAAVFGTLVFAGPWMLVTLTEYTARMLARIAFVAG